MKYLICMRGNRELCRFRSIHVRTITYSIRHIPHFNFFEPNGEQNMIEITDIHIWSKHTVTLFICIVFCMYCSKFRIVLPYLAENKTLRSASQSYPPLHGYWNGSIEVYSGIPYQAHSHFPYTKYHDETWILYFSMSSSIRSIRHIGFTPLKI